jgi:CheY-like chemotaxis protein
MAISMNRTLSLRRILLVEDSENDIEMTMAALEQHNLANQIDVVRDGAEALDYLYCRNEYGHDLPVVVLLAVKLPKLTGKEVLREIRSNSHFQQIPVVMLTSSREEPDLRECYALGCNAYVVKPVDFQQFTEALKVLGCFWALHNEPPV